MPFANGSVSFRQFSIVGKAPKTPDQSILDKLVEHAFKLSGVTVEEIEYGWAGGSHLYDTTFSFENNVYGEAVFFALRIDTNVVPGSVKRAYTALEEQSVAKNNPSGFLSKTQKKEVKDLVAQQCEQEQRQGKYRRSKLVPILWDLTAGKLYASVSGKSLERLLEIFECSFGLTLCPLTAGAIAEHKLGVQAIDDLKPTRFVVGPDGESVYPEYPWVAKQSDPRAFLGNEFLMWMIHQVNTGSQVIDTLQQNGGFKQATVFFDKTISIVCAYDQSGSDVIKGTGPTMSPEFKEGLRAGKVARKAGMIFEIAGNMFTLTLDPETFSFGGTKLPDIQDAESPRSLFEERIKMISDVSHGMEEVYYKFLSERTDMAKWTEITQAINAWILPAVEEEVEA